MRAGGSGGAGREGEPRSAPQRIRPGTPAPTTAKDGVLFKGLLPESPTKALQKQAGGRNPPRPEAHNSIGKAQNGVNGAHIPEARPRYVESLAGNYSNPNTATLLVVATNTLPSATVGAMYLLPEPNWSRLPAAWLLL